MAYKARVAQRRKSLGMTQQELAERCGCTQGRIAQIERGTAPCTVEMLAAIAKALNMELVELIKE